ncbi:MAG TPA: hypothetical protein VFT43_15290 [Candidatus Polarisedimenticolia bacterium]|nr:hypothetical protein [Candidatus Polarisedimenticolia bacterium]
MTSHRERDMFGNDGRLRATEDKGFSLVEVIIAIGILAGVLISIGSMFMLGGRQVKTGKTMTEATTLCHDIMETYDQQSFTGLYQGLGAADTDTSREVFSNITGSPIVSWQPEISRKLEGGWASVKILPVGSASPLRFNTAAGIRLTAKVVWNELGRQQTVQISTVRF